MTQNIVENTIEPDGCVIRRWIIVHEPGLIPEKKRPPDQTHDGAIAFLRELVACRPTGTRYTVVELTWDHDLWLTDGHETLEVDEMFKPRRRHRKKAAA